MSNQIRLILVGLLVMVAMFGGKIGDYIPDFTPNDDIPVIIEVTVPKVAEPTLENRTLVKAIQTIEYEAVDAALLVEFYDDIGVIVRNDPGIIKTTGNFYKFHETSLQLLVSGIDLKKKYSTEDGTDLGVAVDETIKNAMGGLDNIPLDSDSRDDLADILSAIAWGIQNAK